MNDFMDRRRGTGAELEQRVLAAARREQPSPELSAKMARAIGISAGALAASLAQQPTAGAASPQQSATAGGADVAGQHGLAAVGSTSSFGALVPWIAGTSLVAALAAGVAFTQWGDGEASMPPSEPAPSARQIPAEVPAVVPAESPPISRGEADKTTAAEPEQVAGAASAGDVNPSRSVTAKVRAIDPLRDEIALIDAARAAVRAGSGARALALLRDYDARHPKGSFRPEATALRVEALLSVGRKAEARALAERFVAGRKGTPLADRVARLAGLQP